MSDITNLRDTIVPKSDQLNAEQLLAGPVTITITDVRRSDSAEQPLVIHYEGEDGRPWKPCKTMRKVLIAAWGDDGRAWIGRSAVLFNNPEVKWAGVKVGGIRISHLSDLPGTGDSITLSLAETKGKKTAHVIHRLKVAKAANATEKHRAELLLAAQVGTAALRAAWSKVPANIARKIGDGQGCPADLKAVAAKADAAHQAAENPRDSSAGAVDALNAAAATLPPPPPQEAPEGPAQAVGEAPAPAPAPAASGGDDGEVF